MAQDAFSGVFPFSRIVVYFDIHRADLQALSTLDAFAFVAMDAKQGEVTHRLEEDRDGTDIFAEGAIVLEQDGEEDAHHVIDQVADQEKQEHGVLGGFAIMEQQEDQDEGECKHDVTDEAEFLPRTLGLFVRKQVENHGGPATIAAPTPTEEQWSEDFSDGIVQHACTYHSRKKIVPEALNLHVFLADQAEENQHVGADAELDELPGIFPSRP